MADAAPSSSQSKTQRLKTLIVDDEPLAIDRIEAICKGLDKVEVTGSALNGAQALDIAKQSKPDLVLLDMTMPEMDGLETARAFARWETPPALIFVTAHENFAVEAFDLEAVDYVLKPVSPERLERAIERAIDRSRQRGSDAEAASKSEWLEELWVPHRSELLRIAVSEVFRVDAERDYVRLHVGSPLSGGAPAKTYLLLQTIAGLEQKLDPERFIRIHRSTILRRDAIASLRHDGLGVWSAELGNGDALRIGRTHLARVKAMAGR